MIEIGKEDALNVIGLGEGVSFDMFLNYHKSA